MRLIELDVKKEYRRSFGEGCDEKTLDFIFSQGLFPRRLYYPEGAIPIGDPLFTLPDEVERVSYLRRHESLSLRTLSHLSFRSNLIIKNQDQILEEKGEVIVLEDSPSGDDKLEPILANLYPGEKCAYLALDVLKMGGKIYQILVQVGFVRKSKMRIEDTLPPLDSVMVEEERSIIYLLFEDILKEMMFQVHCLCLN